VQVDHLAYKIGALFLGFWNRAVMTVGAYSFTDYATRPAKIGYILITVVAVFVLWLVASIMSESRQ
jgi:hypothetical protein